MFSIWGKVQASSTPLPLTGKEGKQQREEESFYYTSSSGQILSADGSAYAIPTLFSKSFGASTLITEIDRADSKNIHPGKEDENLRSPALSIGDNAVIEEKRSALLESENFIPMSYAKLKLKQLSEELAICKDNYQAKLQALSTQHAQKMVIF